TRLAAAVSQLAAAAPPTGKNCSGSADRHAAWSDHSTPTPPRGARRRRAYPASPAATRNREKISGSSRPLLRTPVLGHDQSKIIAERGAYGSAQGHQDPVQHLVEVTAGQRADDGAQVDELPLGVARLD